MLFVPPAFSASLPPWAVFSLEARVANSPRSNYLGLTRLHSLVFALSSLHHLFNCNLHIVRVHEFCMSAIFMWLYIFCWYGKLAALFQSKKMKCYRWRCVPFSLQRKECNALMRFDLTSFRMLDPAVGRLATWATASRLPQTMWKRFWADISTFEIRRSCPLEMTPRFKSLLMSDDLILS